MESTDRGGTRRLHLRCRGNILKRLVLHSGAANLGLLTRKLFDNGTPRGLAGTLLVIISAACASIRVWSAIATLVKKASRSIVTGLGTCIRTRCRAYLPVTIARANCFAARRDFRPQ